MSKPPAQKVAETSAHFLVSPLGEGGGGQEGRQEKQCKPGSSLVLPHVLSRRHVYFQCKLVGTLISHDITNQNATRKMFAFSFPLPVNVNHASLTLLSVCALESPGLQASGCPWLLRPPMAPSSVLNWPPTPRARELRCFPRTWAGTVPSCCLKKSIGYVFSLCRQGRGAPRKQLTASHF